MTGEEFAAAIERLGLSQVGAARMLNYDDSTVRRWISGRYAIPPPVGALLRLMIKHRISPSTVASLVK